MPTLRPNTAAGAVLRHATLLLPQGPTTDTLFLQGERIAASSAPNAWSCDLRDHLVFPGLVNAHEHLHLNNFPPLAHDTPFPNSYAWMDAYQPFHASPAVRAAHEVPAHLRHWHGALKNLLCGVTTVAHHDPCHPVFADPNFPVAVLKRFGWSHSLGLGLPGNSRSALRYGPDVVESFLDTPPSEPWIIHLAEGTDGVAQAELEALEALGCLAANTVLAHGVGLKATDIDLLLERRAGVVWCPGSNLAMLGATLEPHRLAAAGRLALGSNSRLSSPGDLLQNLKLAALHSDLTPRELAALATEAGSRLLRMPEVGGLAPGQQADLLLVRNTHADPYAALPNLERCDIRAVVRQGMPAIADPDFADWFAAYGIAVTALKLDGKPKLMATALLGPPEAAALEPGLEAMEAIGATL